MNDGDNIFSDRRQRRDRRRQHVSVPSQLNRRQAGGRRKQQFLSKPWWLSTQYHEELVRVPVLMDEGFLPEKEAGMDNPAQRRYRDKQRD